MIRYPFNKSVAYLGLFFALLSPTVSYTDEGVRPGRCEAPLLAEEGNPSAARRTLIDYLKENQIPSFLKNTPQGDIPVILMTSTTAPKVDDFLEHSFGTQAQLQPHHKNDHGRLRLGKMMVDLADPGTRGLGELNSTGIAWKSSESFLKIRARGPDKQTVIVEVAYALKPDELNVAQYYQKMRRAAIIRVPFALGDIRSDVTLPNTINTTATNENCYSFCKSMVIQKQIDFMNAELSRLGVPHVDNFYRDERTQNFITQVRKRIMAADPDDVAIMNNDIATPYLNILAPTFSH